MKLFVHMFLVASTLFVNSFKGNVITTNLMSKKKNIQIRHTILYVNGTEPETPDLIEKYSDWFGLFPREQKWKSVRFTFYIIAAGYCLGEAGDSIKELISSKPL